MSNYQVMMTTHSRLMAMKVQFIGSVIELGLAGLYFLSQEGTSSTHVQHFDLSISHTYNGGIHLITLFYLASIQLLLKTEL